MQASSTKGLRGVITSPQINLETRSSLHTLDDCSTVIWCLKCFNDLHDQLQHDIMDSPTGYEEFMELEVLTASRQGKAKNCSTFRLKEAKVVLRDVQEPSSSWQKEHLQSLCESCRPRGTVRQAAAECVGKCKRGCRRKSCEELLKSWKAPTRRHRLPRHLHDFVVDSTVLHLIEFSDWYNRGRVAKWYGPAKEVPARGKRPVMGAAKKRRTGTCREKHELSRQKKGQERNRKRIRPTSCITKKCKSSPQTVTAVARDKRGRWKTCKDTCRKISSSALTNVKKNEGMNKPNEASQHMTVSSSALKHRGRPRKCKDASQTLPVSLTLAKPKPRDRSAKCKGTLQTMSAPSSALVKKKPRGRPKKCKDSSETAGTPPFPSALTQSKHPVRRRKCQGASNKAPASVEAELKHYGRPRRGRNTPKAKSVSVTTSTGCKHRSRTKKCQNATKMITNKAGEIITQNYSVEIESMGGEKPPAKCFGRPRKRKCSLVTLVPPKQGQLKPVEDEQACTPRLFPSINPDFSIDDSDSGMNINEYLAQLGSYLGCTDHFEMTKHGNVDELTEGLHDENYNLIMGSEMLQNVDAGTLLSDTGTSDERPMGRVEIDSRDEFHDENNNGITDENNNLIPDTESLPIGVTETRPTDSGVTDVICDAVQVSKSKRSRRTQKKREQTSSSNLILRRSERLRVKENYRRCKELWTDEGNRSRAERSSRGIVLGNGSSCNQQNCEKSMDDDLLREFVAMCPLGGDIPFSDEDCLSFLAESPIFNDSGLSPSCFTIDDKEMGNQTVDAISPRTPPNVRRSLREFLLDEYSIGLLASQPIRFPPRCPESGQDRLQECGDVSPGFSPNYPGFGSLMDSQVALLRQLGLDATEEQPACGQGNIEAVARNDGASVVSQTTVQSRQDSSGNSSERDSDRRNLQNKKHEIKNHKVGFQGRLKLPNQRGPVVVIPCIHSGGQSATFAAAEVWLPSCVVESSESNVFFMPMGEWNTRGRSWHVQRVLWKNVADGSWHVSEIQEDLVGTCFVPEEAWLISQGGGDKKYSRVYSVSSLPNDPRAHGCPDLLVPAKASFCSSGYEKQCRGMRRNLKKRQYRCVPIPGVPPALDVQSCLQPVMAFHPVIPHPEIITSPLGIGHVQSMISSSGVQDPRLRLIPVLDQQLEPRFLETAADAAMLLHPSHPGQKAHGFFQPQSNTEGSHCTTHQVTNGHFIGLNGYMALTKDNRCCTQSEVMQSDQALGMIRDSIINNNYKPGDTAVMHSDQSLDAVTDINNNVIVSHPTRMVDNCEHHSQVEELLKTPSSLSEALSQIEVCEDMTVLGRMLLEWCKSDLSFRRHEQVLIGITNRLEKGSSNQSSQNFCAFAASFHATAQKDKYIPEYEDECVLVELGLSAVSQCLAQEEAQNSQKQVQDNPQQVQNALVQAQDLSSQNQSVQFQDQSRLAQAQLQQVQNHLGEVEDRSELAQISLQQVQNQSVQAQDQPLLAQPREDAYCILQMLLHLQLPLTEVLVSSSLTSSYGASHGLPEKVDHSSVRDVLGVLADFDPTMAFIVIQGLGWGHTVMEISEEKEEFNQQLIALAEALLDCKKFWQCRVLLSHLVTYEGCRQPCRHLYSSLLGKLLDTGMDYEPAMMVFEDMMESYLIIPAPILSKLLTLIWKRTDDAGMEDALCVFHYGLGLGIYPMYRKVEDWLWEATVFVGTTEAEVFFSLKTLLDEVHHQHAGQSKDGVGKKGRRDLGVAGVQGRELPRGKSKGYVGKGRCGERKQSVCQEIPAMLKRKGRTVGSTNQEVLKDAASNTTGPRGQTRVIIKLMEPQHIHRGSIQTEEETSTDGFSRMLRMRHTIQGVLENHFHPLTIKPCTKSWDIRSTKNPYTLAINEDALQSCLASQASREACVVIE